MDTIFALSTAPGRAGVAVIRVSGPAAWQSLKRLTTGDIVPRQTHLRRLTHPGTGIVLDQAMVIGFKAPASFTGEDCVEYHLHGGTAVVAGVLECLGHESGHRMALPGEFTRRAFENGKLDLTAAEAVADLIHAETESQKLQALRQMDGSLFRLYEGWKERIARILALMEADLDFSDQDLPEDMLLKVRPDVSDIKNEIEAHLQDGHRGEILRDGFHIIILGAPNAGKSSLVNALARRDVAIVSPLAGTTRDMIDVHLNLGGYAVILTDTAGLRDNRDDSVHGQIEAEGIRRALARAENAHLRLYLIDGTETNPVLPAPDMRTMVVVNKSDAPDFTNRNADCVISVETGEGIDTLLALLHGRVKEQLETGGDAPLLTRARHREALSLAVEHLDRSMVAPLPELATEDLRLALRALGSLTGRVDIEDLLDMIFRDFCIGK